MNIRKIMEQELNGLIANQEKYVSGESLNSKYWYYYFSSKIYVLRHLLCYKKIKKSHVEGLRKEIEEKYKKIKVIHESERNMDQTFEGVYFEAMFDIIDNWVVSKLFDKNGTSSVVMR